MHLKVGSKNNSLKIWAHEASGKEDTHPQVSMENNQGTQNLRTIYNEVMRNKRKRRNLRRWRRWWLDLPEVNRELHLNEWNLPRVQRYEESARQFAEDILGVMENLEWVLRLFELSIEFGHWTMILIHISQDYDHDRAREWIEANILENYVVVDRTGYLNDQVMIDV